MFRIAIVPKAGTIYGRHNPVRPWFADPLEWSFYRFFPSPGSIHPLEGIAIGLRPKQQMEEVYDFRFLSPHPSNPNPNLGTSSNSYGNGLHYKEVIKILHSDLPLAAVPMASQTWKARKSQSKRKLLPSMHLRYCPDFQIV